MPGGSRRRILVVDDDSDIRFLNAEVLKQSGYEADTAEDGEAAWKTLHAVSYDASSYDLLITDHDMPRLTGLDWSRSCMPPAWPCRSSWPQEHCPRRNSPNTPGSSLPPRCSSPIPSTDCWKR